MEPAAAKPLSEGNVDKIGVIASTICAIHCAVCALLPFAFVGLGLGFLMSPEIEWALTLGAVAFATVALIQGWRIHRSLFPTGFLILGIIGLMTSRGIEMTSGHHDHHDEHHHSEHHDEHHHIENHSENHSENHHEKSAHAEEKAVAALHASTSHHEEHHKDDDHHAEEGDSAHTLGGLIGLLGGFILVLGHIFNIRVSQRCREECCEEPIPNT